MRILLSNDDGINAPGLAVLEEIARSLSDDIWVCAPAEEQSGAGHSLTLHQPVRLRQHGEKRFSVTGTPTDAVNLALRKLFPDGPPDLVLSGVNAGENLGDDITYSGTVSAAMEAALAGIPAIALSQQQKVAGLYGGDRFAITREWGPRVLAQLAGQAKNTRSLVNVNFPDVAPDAVAGIKVVRQGFHDYARGSLHEAVDPRGRPYFWFGLDGIEHTPDHDTDLEAVADGFIAVTPLQLDLTDHAALAALAGKFAS